MTEKKTGRPATYTEEQVLQGIGIVEENGDIPTGDAVKKAMCAHSDTSDQVFRRHMISHSGVSDHPEMTPSGAVW